MASESELWASYFYPETYNAATMRGTLRNWFEERDAGVLSSLEYGVTVRRQRQLLSGDAAVPRTYDANHVRAIHRHLFQDIYNWAGEYRTVNIFKGTPGGFAKVLGGEIERYLGDMAELVKSTPWAGLDRGEFAEHCAAVFAYLNQAHPFREGNGRTSKVFMAQVSELSRYSFDYSLVTPADWNEASKWSGPDLFAYPPHPASLVPVFLAMTVGHA